jgi:site-specific recombinase XerD
MRGSRRSSCPRPTFGNVPTESDPLVDAFLGSLALSRRTVELHRGDLRAFVSWARAQALTLDQMTADDLSRYIHALQQKGRKPATVVRHGYSLRNFYAWMETRGHVTSNPAQHLIKSVLPGGRTLTETLTLEELRQVFAATTSPNDRAVLGLLAVNGLNTSAIAEARLRDLTESQAGWQLRLRNDVIAPLPPLVSDALLTAIGSRRQGPLLLNTWGKPLNGHAIRRIVQRSVAAAGLALDVAADTLTFTMRDIAIREATFVEVIQGLPTLGERTLTRRARMQPPPPQHLSFHVAALVTDQRDSTTAMLDQADALGNLPFVHFAVPMMVAGAAFERHLRHLAVTCEAIGPTREGDMMFYAGQLKRVGVITEAEVQLVPDLAKKRNDAAHGRFDGLSQEDVVRSLATIRRLVKSHPWDATA